MSAEADDAPNITYKYIRGRELLYRKDNSTNQIWYLYNGHGDVVELTEEHATRLKTYDYDAFGNETLQDDPGFEIYNPFLYCGEYYDEETGLIYLRARYYDPSIGRFISEDPIQDGTNWYAYCANNPVMFVDPSGYMATPYGNGNVVQNWKDTFFSTYQQYSGEALQFASNQALGTLKTTNFVYNSENTWARALIKDISIQNHYTNNNSLNVTGFINDQDVGKAAQVQMGNPALGSNACGWVASYNAFKVLNNKVSPADIVFFFESNDYLIFDGVFGVNPLAFDHLFEVYGFSSSTIYFDDTNIDLLAQSSQTCILAYAYLSEQNAGAHFVNVTWNQDKQAYRVYNDNWESTTSISQFLSDNEYVFISLTTINEREVYYA